MKEMLVIFTPIKWNMYHHVNSTYGLYRAVEEYLGNKLPGELSQHYPPFFGADSSL